MISGAHVVVYSKDAEADRAFFRDVLGFSSVDAGGGWLIFALPPAELAAHPTDDAGHHELYLM
jgi:catechol 2,3-dioxygenase-like lactoylglutathione lyase family enzyme